ncbi:bifunctional DNA primase/polymerase [Streptomyces sp. H10-C2]|uniref:bifunctional DNA primase/polymerase n=1 Tax=unclassified Streptomyces TaxID=2593676 RepID=UPI0024B98A5F|nr:MULTISPECIES: bifunctional DNA primase/polymerase [unclassified Streptomyces]MDJ0342091.1 bifunctional DNA primase/polymerase [Streptomyces sp. PH10-H1]MDJ0368433.1 bifunctional DNA primase/polymerase [Streptomyces sp. H10-C2]
MATSVLHVAALANALAAASRQLAVIPLSRTKLPAVRSPHRGDSPPVRCLGECGRIGHGVHDATTEPDAIRALFAAAPWAIGYGIACGLPPHHLIGLDLDVKHGLDGTATLTATASTHGFTVPDTVTVLTPSGGRHLWFTGPAGTTVPNSVGRAGTAPGPGIDVRGSGGYLVGPGSITNAGRYLLAPHSPALPAARVPDRLLRLLTPPPPSTPHRGTAQHPLALVQFVRDSPQGQRNTRLYWAACRAYESGHGDTLAPALIDAAAGTGLPRQEAAATIASAARHAQSPL